MANTKNAPGNAMQTGPTGTPHTWRRNRLELNFRREHIDSSSVQRFTFVSEASGGKAKLPPLLLLNTPA